MGSVRLCPPSTTHEAKIILRVLILIFQATTFGLQAALGGSIEAFATATLSQTSTCWRPSTKKGTTSTTGAMTHDD